MQSLGFESPRTIEAALDMLSSVNGGEARILAGGTDLLVQMHIGGRAPSLIVDIKRIPELMALSLDGEGLCIGAAVCAAEIAELAGLPEVYPGLAEALALIGSAQIQGRASVGGNLCNGSPAADGVPSLLVLGAECVVAGPAGRRTVPIDGFVSGPGETVLGPTELLVEIRVPPPAAHSADAYLRFIPRSEMDIAVVGVAVSLTLDEAGRCSAARVALGAVAPRAFLAPAVPQFLIGSELDAETLSRAGAAASAAASPVDDIRGTARYRHQLVEVLTRRAITSAAGRAKMRH